MLREDSSDSDNDNVALVAEHEVKPLSPSRRHNQFTALEISNDLNVRITRALRSHRWRWYLLAICLPLVLILVFFSLKLGRLFGGVSIICADTIAEQRMRDAELRALFLLSNQKTGLLHLWNRTDLRSNTSSTAITPSASNNQRSPFAESVSPGATVSNSPEAFKSAIMDLVKFNELAQAALLSTHESMNNSLNVMDDNVDAYSSSSRIDACPMVDPPAHGRTIEWKPKEKRFLFAICLSGQMSNHLICLEKHMFFSALLGRVLVLPSIKVDYDYSRVLDIDHINQCLGREVVISFDDFMAKMKYKLKIDRFICYIASPQCFLDEEHIKRLKNLGISLGKFELAWPEDAKITEQRKRVVADIISKFSSDDEVIAIGDMFYADVEEEWMKQPGGPIGHKCKALIQPNQLINRSAQQFVQTFLGSNFIALHFRRHGFLKFCNVKKESCFYPIPQAAECILRVVERTKARVIYLSTDAGESETNLLNSLLVLNGKFIPLVKRPRHDSAEKWDAPLYRNHIGGDAQVEAMLDKTISALSTVFIGSSGSTFTEDILRLRRGWGIASQCDEYLCNGELPNFIAENE